MYFQTGQTMTNNNKKPSKYSVYNQTWFDFCTMPVSKCKQKRVICKECGKYGHITYWLDVTQHSYNDYNELCFNVIILVAHAHYVLDKDIVRHVIHKVAETTIPEKYCTRIYVLKKRKLPKHVIDMLDGLGE